MLPVDFYDEPGVTCFSAVFAIPPQMVMGTVPRAMAPGEARSIYMAAKAKAFCVLYSWA